MTGTEVAARLHDLVQALWTGGLVAIDAVETPARFRVDGLDRNQVGAVGRAVFAAFNTYEVGLAGAALATLGGASRWRRAAVGAMAAAALAEHRLVRPRLAELGAALDFTTEERDDPRFDDFSRLHRLYVALDAAKMALGVATVVGGR